MKKTFALIFTATILFLAGCCTSHKTTVWEYKIIKGNTGSDNSSLPPLEQQLNQAAAEGWQIASYAGGSDINAAIILKRRKNE